MGKIKIQHEVSEQLLADILMIASKNAIDGWCDVVVFVQTEDPIYCRMEIIELEDEKPHTISCETILLGMQKIVDMELPPPIRGNLITTLSQIREWIVVSIMNEDATMIDDYVADAIIQQALFGEQLYS